MSSSLGTQLEARFGRFIRDEIAKGRFRSEAEVLEAALELLEERERRLAELRAALVQAENHEAVRDTRDGQEA